MLSWLCSACTTDAFCAAIFIVLVRDFGFFSEKYLIVVPASRYCFSRTGPSLNERETEYALNYAREEMEGTRARDDVL